MNGRALSRTSGDNLSGRMEMLRRGRHNYDVIRAGKERVNHPSRGDSTTCGSLILNHLIKKIKLKRLQGRFNFPRS